MERKAVYKAVADFGQIRRSARQARREIKDLKKDADSLDSQLDETFGDKFNKSLKELGSRLKKADKSIKMDIVLDEKGLPTTIERVTKRASRGKSIKVPLEVDGKGSRKSATKALEALGQDLQQASSRGGLLPQILQTVKWPAIFVGASLVGSAISSLIVAVVGLVDTLGPLIGLLAGLPGALAGAGLAAGAVVLAFKGMGDVIKATIKVEEEHRIALDDLTASEKDLQAQTEKLSPAGRTFLATLLALRPALAVLQGVAQRAVLPGFTQALQTLTTLTPQVTRAVSILGRQIGKVVAGLATAAVDGGLSQLLEMASSTGIFDVAGQGLQAMVRAFIQLAIAGEPVLKFFADMIRNLGVYMERTVNAGIASGRLAAFLQRAIEVAKTWGRILRDLTATVYNFFKGGSSLSSEFLERMQAATAKWRAFTESAEGKNSIAAFFREAKPAIDATLRLMGAMLKSFGKLSQNSGLASILDQITSKLLPVIEDAIQGTSQNFGPALVNLITQLAQAFGTLAGTSGPLTTYVKILGQIIGFLNILMTNFGFLSSIMTNIIFLFTTMGAAAKLIQLAGVILGVKRLAATFNGLKVAILTYQAVVAGAEVETEGFAATLGASAALLGGPVTLAIMAVVTAIGLLTLGWFKARQEQAEFNKAVEATKDRLADIEVPITEVSELFGKDDFTQRFGKELDLADKSLAEFQHALTGPKDELDTVKDAFNDFKVDFGGNLGVDSKEFEDKMRGLGTTLGDFIADLAATGELTEGDLQAIFGDVEKQAEAAKDGLTELINDDPGNKVAEKALHDLENGLISTEEAQRIYRAQLKLAGKDTEEFTGEVLTAAEALAKLNDQQLAELDETFANWNSELTAVDDMEAATDALEEYRKGVSATGKETQDALDSLHDAEDGVADANERLVDAQQDLNDAREEAADRVKELRREIDSLAASEASLRVDLAKAKEDAAAARADKLSALDIAEADANVGEVNARLADNIADRQEAEEELAKRQMGWSPEILEAQEKIKDAQEAVADAQERVRDATDRVTEAIEKEGTAAERLEELQRKARLASLAAAEAAGAEHDSAIGKIRAQITALEDLATTLAPDDPLRKYLQAYIEDLKKLEKRYVTEVELKMVMTMEALAGDKKLMPQIDPETGKFSFRGQARGSGQMGYVREGITAVGEAGMELLEKRGSRVYVHNNRNTKKRIARMHRGGGVGIDPSTEVMRILRKGEGVASVGAMQNLERAVGSSSSTATTTTDNRKLEVSFNELPDNPRQTAEAIMWEWR